MNEIQHVHQIDAETEEFILGHQLRPGMIVLLFGQSGGRINAWRDPSVVSEWCTVTDTICFAERDNGRGMSFTGVYSDGTSHVRSYLDCEGWVVKKDSIP